MTEELKLRDYARLGLRLEIERLQKALEGLDGDGRVTPASRKKASQKVAGTGWTPAKRKRHAKMMRERWAEKRKAQLK